MARHSEVASGCIGGDTILGLHCCGHVISLAIRGGMTTGLRRIGRVGNLENAHIFLAKTEESAFSFLI